MKIRTDFVTNSSSSSFVVMGRGKHIQIEPKVDVYTIGADGETEFGWGPEAIQDMHSRINFAFIQTVFGKHVERYEMLKNVLMRGGLGTQKIQIGISDSWESEDGLHWAYIDHQSSFVEGKNLEIFENEDVLYDFIFSSDSKIVLDNDNR